MRGAGVGRVEQRFRPRHAGRDGFADAQRAHAKAGHDRAGGFAPRHEDAPDAGFHQRGGDVGKRPLDHGSGGFPAETGLRRGDPVRGGRGVDDARPVRAVPAGEGDGLGDVPAVILGKGQRIEGKAGALPREPRHLRLRRLRTASGEHEREARRVDGGRGHGAVRTDAEVDAEPAGHAAAARDQRVPGAGRADGPQIRVGQRVADEPRRALRRKFIHTGFDGFDAFPDGFQRNQPAFARRLRVHEPDEVRVGHGRQRVAAHGGFVQQPVAHEKVTLIDRPLVFGKGGADDRAVAAEGLEQGLRHRADVALGGGVEGGAVFPEELAAARGAQGFERGEGLADGLFHGDGADLQGHDQRVGLCGGFRGQRGIRHTQKLDSAHPVAAQGFGKVGAAGEIVGDAAKNGSHGIRLLWGEEVRRPAQESGSARAGPAASGRGGRWLPAPPPRPAPWSGLRRR